MSSFDVGLGIHIVFVNRDFGFITIMSVSPKRERGFVQKGYSII